MKYRIQRRILNPVKHLRWSFLRQYLTAFSRKLFSQKAPSWIFDMVVNKPLGFHYNRQAAFIRRNVFQNFRVVWRIPKSAFCSMLTSETLKQGVKYVQSQP